MSEKTAARKVCLIKFHCVRTQWTFKTSLPVVNVFSPFHQHQIFEHRRTSRILLDFFSTAVMARSFNFNPLKIKIITDFSEDVSSLHHIPSFPPCWVVETLNQLLCSFAKKCCDTTCDTTRKFRAFLCNYVINNFSLLLFFHFSFLFPFLSIGSRIFRPKIRNFRQPSFSLFFKVRNLSPSPDICNVELPISRALWPYLGSVSMFWIKKWDTR